VDPVVVKCGGNAAVDGAAICADVAELHAAGVPVVMVHGGSADIDSLADRLGVPRRRLVAADGVSTRYTDDATMEVVRLALAGAVKPRLVAELTRLGVPAVGLTGADGRLLRIRAAGPTRAVVDGRTVLVRDNRAGRIAGVRSSVLLTLLGGGFLPVVSPPAVTSDGVTVNVDADRVAAAVAVALGASDLLLLTGAPGVLRDGTVLAELPVGPQPPAFAGGGMALKLHAGHEALAGGVPRVQVAPGTGPSPVRDALAGAGTRLVVAP
jgi:[amino group carrier protein]-L-2-aminoadipate/L-glutamate 6-kinase